MEMVIIITIGVNRCSSQPYVSSLISAEDEAPVGSQGLIAIPVIIYVQSECFETLVREVDLVGGRGQGTEISD
jgi:hypothetical protein